MPSNQRNILQGGSIIIVRMAANQWREITLINDVLKSAKKKNNPKQNKKTRQPMIHPKVSILSSTLSYIS